MNWRIGFWRNGADIPMRAQRCWLLPVRRPTTPSPLLPGAEGEEYELDLVLRNNRTTEEHPLGLFHPHGEYHHIKKENIGLIEVMGLAILPPRLLQEAELMEQALSCPEERGGDFQRDRRWKSIWIGMPI